MNTFQKRNINRILELVILRLVFNRSRDLSNRKTQSSFQYSILRGSCIANCLRRTFGDHWQDQRIEETLEQDFEQRIPYQYLNVAYYKVGKLKGNGQKFSKWLPCHK